MFCKGSVSPQRAWGENQWLTGEAPGGLPWGTPTLTLSGLDAVTFIIVDAERTNSWYMVYWGIGWQKDLLRRFYRFTVLNVITWWVFMALTSEHMKIQTPIAQAFYDELSLDSAPSEIKADDRGCLAAAHWRLGDAFWPSRDLTQKRLLSHRRLYFCGRDWLWKGSLFVNFRF